MTDVPIAPAPTDPSSARIRSGARRLAAALVVYGVVGLLVAGLGLAALLWAGSRVGGLADQTSAQVDSIISTLDRTATALDDASASAVSFGVTLERTPPVVRQASDTIGNLQGNIRSIEQQLGALSILGSRPLAGVGQRFGQIATDIEGLDTRLELIASSLEENKASLLDNAESLGALGDRIGTLADDLRGGIIQDGLEDVQLVLMVLSILLVAATATPAAASLWIGLWLRRESGATV
jgi:hypothetical protein